MKSENDGIVWLPNMSVYNKQIDNQHKKLIDALRKFNEIISLRVDVEQLKKITTTFEEYANEHLDFEESYMKENNFPNFDKHKKVHDLYREYFNIFKTKFHAETSSNYLLSDAALAMLIDAERFLSSWWANHIIVDDHAYALYIKSKKK